MCSFEFEYPKAYLIDLIMEKEIVHTRLLELFVFYVCINISLYIIFIKYYIRLILFVCLINVENNPNKIS